MRGTDAAKMPCKDPTERQVSYQRATGNKSSPYERITVGKKAIAAVQDGQLRYALERAVNDNNNPDKRWLFDVIAHADDTLKVIYFPDRDSNNRNN